MKITIVGAGRVGVHLAKYFSDENQDVYLVDEDRRVLNNLESDFNMRTFAGDPLDFNTLRDANAHNADIFVAVTAKTADNLVACALAKSMGARKTIARVDKYDFLMQRNMEVVRRMGVDHVVYPDYLAALSVISALQHPWCDGWNEFSEGAIIMTAVQVTDKSPIVGQYLKDMQSLSRSMHVSALKRNSVTIIPRGTDMVLANDILYITTVPEGLDVVRQCTGKEEIAVKKVIMMGGSSVAEMTARLASDDFSFVIVEKNIDRCRELTEVCPDCDIIYGDSSEAEVLDEAGIANCQAFVALSDSSESNILGCLTARDCGVGRTVVEIEKEQYIAKGESFNIGAIINKPIITANYIFQLILDNDLSTSKCFAMKDADVAAIEIPDGSKLTKCQVKDLSLPRGVTFAGLIREGKGEIVTGNTVFKPGDNVIVFCLSGSLNKVENLLRKK